MSTPLIAHALAPPSLSQMSQGPRSGDYYVFVIVFLLASAVIVPVFKRLKISPVLGFLLVGVLLGPDVMGQIAHEWPQAAAFAVTRSHTAHSLAELGVVFLLFSIGLELTFERLKTMRRMVFGLGAAQVLASTAVLTGLFLLMHHSFPAAMTLGMALALSSTAMVVPVLAEKKALNTPAGKGVFAVLLAQDLAVAPIMVAIGMITSAAGVSAKIGGTGRRRSGRFPGPVDPDPGLDRQWACWSSAAAFCSGLCSRAWRGRKAASCSWRPVFWSCWRRARSPSCSA